MLMRLIRWWLRRRGLEPIETAERRRMQAVIENYDRMVLRGLAHRRGETARH